MRSRGVVHNGMRSVSNVEATRDFDPDETLFVVSSKTFTTLLRHVLRYTLR